MYDVKKNSFASTLLIHIYQNFIITKNQHFLTMEYSWQIPVFVVKKLNQGSRKALLQ